MAAPSTGQAVDVEATLPGGIASAGKAPSAGSEEDEEVTGSRTACEAGRMRWGGTTKP